MRIEKILPEYPLSIVVNTTKYGAGTIDNLFEFVNCECETYITVLTDKYHLRIEADFSDYLTVLK